MAENKITAKTGDVENIIAEHENSTAAAVDGAISNAAIAERDAEDLFAISIGADTFQLSLLSNKYTVEEGSPIKELSTEFANAYRVREKKANKRSGNEENYILVFQKNFAPRIRAISKLISVTNSNFQNIQDAGTVQMSNGQTQFALVLPIIKGIRLSDLLAKEGQLPEKFVNQVVITSVNNALGFLSKYNVLHGNINLNTIIFQPELERVIVTECFSHYCGFQQSSFYEPIDRAQCLPIAKGEADETADFFALGAVVSALLQGAGLFDSAREAGMLADRLIKSSYSTYLIQQERFGSIKEFLKGVLQDHPSERWLYSDVTEWQARKKGTAASTAHPLKESLTGYEFNNKGHLGRRALAHDMFLHWNAAKLEVKIDDLGRWLRLNVMRPDLSDELDDSINIARRKETVIADDDLTKALSVLDPDGPIRQNEFAANAYGLPQMLAFGLARGKREYAQFVADCLNSGLLTHWLELQPPLEDYDYYKMYWSSITVSKYIRKSGFGFGIERVLYDMNPGLPCQSSLFSKNCVLSIDSLLKALDALPEDLHDKQDPMDRHIAAFIASKLSLEDEVRIKSVRHYPHFAKSPQLLMMAILTLGQAESKTRNLKSLCRWLQKRSEPLIASVQGKSIRKEFQQAIAEEVKAGDLQRLFGTITSPNFIKRDAFGLAEAMKEYQRYSKEINALVKQETIERVAYSYGLKIAVLTGYTVCFGTLLALVLQL